MAKPNYSFEKRQRENAKKQKKQEKLARKTTGPNDHESGDVVEGAGPAGGQEPAPPAERSDTP